MRVLLLHGLMASSETWWQVAPGLADAGWEPSALDLTWHGSAPRPGGDVTADAMAADVATRLEGPVDAVVGHSLGAVVALRLAAGHPTGARCLVLEDPPARRRRDLLELAASVRADGRTARTDPERLSHREREANPTWADRDVTASAAAVAAADSERLADGVFATLTWRLPDLVAASTLPVTVLAADEPLSALEQPGRHRVRELLGTDRFVEIAGGHCLHRDAPADWLAAVTAALTRDAGRG